MHCFFSQTDRENVFADILDRKEAFKDYRKNATLEFFQGGYCILFVKNLRLL